MQETNENQAVEKDKKTPALIIGIGACIVLLVIIMNRFTGCINTVSEAAKAQFGDTYNSTKENVYQEYYQSAFDYAEAKNHISNDVKIVINGITEVSKLEVYEASDTEYVIYKYDDNGFEAWYEVNGTCTYYVDLEKSEFLVDQSRKTVTIKIPKPERKYNIDIPTRLFYDDDTIDVMNTGIEINNGSALEGLKNVRDAEAKSREKIINYFSNAGTLDEKAQGAALSVLKSLVEWANPDVEGLKVTVEFMN